MSRRISFGSRVLLYVSWCSASKTSENILLTTETEFDTEHEHCLAHAEPQQVLVREDPSALRTSSLP